jgi:hypothetical protein
MPTVAEHTEIKSLTSDEIVQHAPEILAIAHEFYDEGSLAGKLNEHTFIHDWAHFVELGLGVYLAALKDGKVIGVLGGVLHRDPPTGDMHASEAFWFVGKIYRGVGLQLFKAYEEWAVMAGAKRISMVHLENEKSNTRLSELYIKSGYRKVETTYLKEVS